MTTGETLVHRAQVAELRRGLEVRLPDCYRQRCNIYSSTVHKKTAEL